MWKMGKVDMALGNGETLEGSQSWTLVAFQCEGPLFFIVFIYLFWWFWESHQGLAF